MTGRDETPRRRARPARAGFVLLLLVGGILVAGPAAAGDDDSDAGMVARPARLPERRPATLPNMEFFGEQLEPLLETACSECHRGGRAGGYDLAFGDVVGGAEARVYRNFKATLAFVDRDDPAVSALLRKGLPPADGGLAHGPGPYLDPGSELERVLREFLAGATPANRPPAPRARLPRHAVAGEAFDLDASPTTDAEGHAIAVRWEVVDRPVGSSAAPLDPHALRTRFVPDHAGTYRFRLRAGDGRIEALPRTLVLEVAERGAGGDGAMGDRSGMPGDVDDMGGMPGDVDDMPGGMHGPSMSDGPLPVPPPPTGVRAGAGPPLDIPLDQRRLARGLFFDLRRRGPSPAELAWAVQLEPAELIDAMLADEATWAAWLETELYYYLLIDRFRPVSDRMLELPGRLAGGKATVRDATREIVVSAEFNTRNPGNDTFVTVVFEQLLGMVVQDEKRLLEAGKKMYDGYPARIFRELGRSQSDIVQIVLGREDCTRLFLERQYTLLFGRPAAKGALDETVARVHADPDTYRDVLREWLLSRTYAGRTAIPRPKGDLVFIRTLFVDLLGREPDFDEFRNMRNAFLALSDPAPIRNVLAQVLLDAAASNLPSKDEVAKAPEDWVRRQFLRLLGREPTSQEVDLFVSTLGEYGCEPKTLLLALVTSPDYQYY